MLLDAEHFFDGFALDPGYALDCLRAAADAGAERLVLCDTNGGSLPPQIRTALAVVSEALPGVALGHPHATTTPAARSPTRSTAVEAGATQVQGTINGIGERTGNANLITIIADLQLKMGVELLAPEQPRAPDRDGALRRRAAQPLARTRRSRTSASTPSRTRPACTPPACAPTRRPSSTSTRRSSATAATC